MGNTLLFCNCNTQETQLVRPDCYTQDNLGGGNGYKIRYKGSRASQIGKGPYPVTTTDNLNMQQGQLHSVTKPSHDGQIQLKSSTSNKESNGVLSVQTKQSSFKWNIAKGLYDSSSRKNLLTQDPQALKQKWCQFHIEENEDSYDEEDSFESPENAAALQIRSQRTRSSTLSQALRSARIQQQLQDSSFCTENSEEDQIQKFNFINAEQFAVEREKLKIMNQHRLCQIYYKPTCQDGDTPVEEVMLSGLKAELEAEDARFENTCEWIDESIGNSSPLDQIEFNMSLIELDENGDTIDEVVGYKSDNLIENYVNSLTHSDTSNDNSQPLKSLDCSFLNL